MYGGLLLLAHAENARTAGSPGPWGPAGVFKGGVACLELLIYVGYHKNIEYYNTKRGVYSHRRAAVAVWGAFRRRRLHHDVGHVTGVIAALLDLLKRQEVKLNGSQHTWTYDCLLFGCFDFRHFFFCACHKATRGPVPCHSQAGTWTGSDWGAAWHHAGDHGSYENERPRCTAPPCSGCRMRQRAACPSRWVTGKMWRGAVEGGTKKQQRRKQVTHLAHAKQRQQS